MIVKLVFLGKLADLAGAEESELTLEKAKADWADLLVSLEQLYSGELVAALRGDRVRIALNGEVLADKAALLIGSGDEIALLPPVSGG